MKISSHLPYLNAMCSFLSPCREWLSEMGLCFVPCHIFTPGKKKVMDWDHDLNKRDLNYIRHALMRVLWLFSNLQFLENFDLLIPTLADFCFSFGTLIVEDIWTVLKKKRCFVGIVHKRATIISIRSRSDITSSSVLKQCWKAGFYVFDILTCH